MKKDKKIIRRLNRRKKCDLWFGDTPIDLIIGGLLGWIIATLFFITIVRL